MSNMDLIGSPEKLDYIMYFFPMVSAGFLYFSFPTSWNLIILIVATLSVICMESYHLAYKASATPEENIKLLTDLKNIGIGGKGNLSLVMRHPAFALFNLAWLIMYFWTLVRLFPHRSNNIFILVFLVQIGLFMISELKLLFLKRMVS